MCANMIIWSWLLIKPAPVTTYFFRGGNTYLKQVEKDSVWKRLRPHSKLPDFDGCFWQAKFWIRGSVCATLRHFREVLSYWGFCLSEVIFVWGSFYSISPWCKQQVEETSKQVLVSTISKEDNRIEKSKKEKHKKVRGKRNNMKTINKYFYCLT